VTENKYKGNNAVSLMSPIVDEQWMRPGHRSRSFEFLSVHSVGWVTQKGIKNAVSVISKGAVLSVHLKSMPAQFKYCVVHNSNEIAISVV